MKYLYTKNEHFTKFYEDNNYNERVSKFLKILPTSKGFKLRKINELFETEIETEYKKIYDDNGLKTFLFKTNSNTKYRLDLVLDYDSKLNDFINHISFTTSNNDYDDDTYENLTNKNESIELLNRLRFILKDLVSRNKVYNYFCIGGTDLESKNNIYKYFLKVVVGEDGFKKIDTDDYKTGWGLYFKI